MFSQWNSSDHANLETSSQQTWTLAPIHPYGAWLRDVIGVDIHQSPTLIYSWFGMMLVGRDIIHRHTQQQYEKWKQLAADAGPNGEVLHYFERTFNLLFNQTTQFIHTQT